MTSRRLRIVSRLASFAALALPLAALAEGEGNQNGIGYSVLAIPTLGPLGLVGLAAGVAGAGILISRNRRKNDKD